MEINSGSCHERKYPASLLFAACAFVLFWNLGTRGLNEPDEGRYASISQQMLQDHDWLVPRLQQQLHFSKPPLSYWLAASAFRFFGETEWAARLTPALAAFSILLLTWLMARRYGRSLVIAS